MNIKIDRQTFITIGLVVLYAMTLLVTWDLRAAMHEEVMSTGKIVEMNDRVLVIETENKIKHSIDMKSVTPGQDLKVGTETTVMHRMDPKKIMSKIDYDFSLPEKMNVGMMREVLRYMGVFFWSMDNAMEKTKNKKVGLKSKSGYLWKKFTEIFEAHAEESLYGCFHAGWPTRLGTDRRTCLSPWTSSSSGYTPCGPTGVYRCNPVVFGPGISTPSTDSTSPAVANENTDAGMCVRVERSSQIVGACLVATAGEDALDAHIRRLIPREGASEADVTLQQNFQRYVSSIDRFCRGSAGHVNGACQYLNDRLATLRFNSGAAERTCTILQNPAPPSGMGSCRTIKISCTQGGNSMVGFVRGDRVGLIPRAGNSQIRNGHMNRDLITSVGELVKTPCGGDGDEIQFGESCSVVSSENIQQGMNPAEGVTGCTGSLCSVYANCVASAGSETTPGFTHNVLLTCDCSLLGGNPGTASGAQLRACFDQQFAQVTVRGPEHFSPASGATSR